MAADDLDIQSLPEPSHAGDVVAQDVCLFAKTGNAVTSPKLGTDTQLPLFSGRTDAVVTTVQLGRSEVEDQFRSAS